MILGAGADLKITFTEARLANDLLFDAFGTLC
jgi:hypothetical protein